MNEQNSNLNSIQDFLSFYSYNPNLNQIINDSIYESYIIRCKNGGKIYIKKKNRGKFTEYCNGKVTQKCIQRGKNSPNPKIRKRAIFADNARHFKH